MHDAKGDSAAVLQKDGGDKNLPGHTGWKAVALQVKGHPLCQPRGELPEDPSQLHGKSASHGQRIRSEAG